MKKGTGFGGVVLAILFALVLAPLCAADEGSIRVDVSKVENWDPSLLIILLLSGVVIVLLVIAIRAAIAHTKGPKSTRLPHPGKRISIRKEEPGFKDDTYYKSVFKKPAVHIIDEKAKSVELPATIPDVERYLKEDERIVVNVLKMKNKTCSQGTIRVVTDFSKARLSRILAELEQRGIVYKQRSGRKNLVTLRT